MLKDYSGNVMTDTYSHLINALKYRVSKNYAPDIKKNISKLLSLLHISFCEFQLEIWYSN